MNFIYISITDASKPQGFSLAYWNCILQRWTVYRENASMFSDDEKRDQPELPFSAKWGKF